MGTRVDRADISSEIELELPVEKAPDGFRATKNGDVAGKIVFSR